MQKYTLIALILTAIQLVTCQEDLFRKHIELHSKEYENYEEYQIRKEIFEQNLKKSQELAINNPLAEFDVVASPFSDLSEEEFKFRLGYRNPLNRQYLQSKKLDLSNVPEKLDYRDQNVVTKVKDQGQCGSCWVFSVVETIESQYLLHHKNSTALLLSEEQVNCCDYGRGDLGCDGGMPETAYDYIVTAGGIESEKAYPYQSGGAYWDQCRVDAQSAQDCKFDKSKVSATISGYQNVSRKGDENELLQGLVDLGPLSVCVDASTWQTYTKGILTNCPQTLDHCVQLVGYDKTGSTPYWIVRNSWAEYWGIQGYIHVAMGSNQCGIANEATIPISVEVAKNQQNFVLEQIEI